MRSQRVRTREDVGRNSRSKPVRRSTVPTMESSGIARSPSSRSLTREGGDHLVEGQDDVDVAALAAEEPRQARHGLAPARAQEVVLGVRGGEAGAQRGHGGGGIPYGRTAATPCACLHKRHCVWSAKLPRVVRTGTRM